MPFVWGVISTVAAATELDAVASVLAPVPVPFPLWAGRATTQTPTAISDDAAATCAVNVVDDVHVTAVCVEVPCTCAVDPVTAAMSPDAPGNAPPPAPPAPANLP